MTGSSGVVVKAFSTNTRIAGAFNQRQAVSGRGQKGVAMSGGQCNQWDVSHFENFSKMAQVF